MRVRVIKKYQDKHTRAIHEVGKEITISKERFAEIEKAGKYVEPVENTEDGLTRASDLQPVAEKETATVGLAAKNADNDTANAQQNDAEPSLDEMSLAELKAYAKEHDVDLNGARTKATIADAIRAAEK